MEAIKNITKYTGGINMSKMKLYELSQNYNNLYDLLENEEVPIDVIEEALTEIEDEIEDKVDNTAKLIKHFEGTIKMFKEEEDRLKARRKVYENRVKSLKDYLLNQFEFMERNKVEANTFTVRRQANPPSLEIQNEEEIDEQYLIPQKPKPDKKTILNDLKAGKKVAGASLKPESHHIRIQ